MKYVLGIDGGGSKTVCALASESADLLDVASAGPSNIRKVGLDSARESLTSVVESVMSRLSSGDTCMALCAGLAGLRHTNDRELLVDMLKGLVPAQHHFVVGDEIIALFGGTDRHPGAVVIAGTGSICAGMSRAGKVCEVGGWEYFLGDEGSAYWIVTQALRAAVASFDGRSEKSILEKALLSPLGCSSVYDLHARLCGHFPRDPQSMTPSEIAALFPHVLEAAQEGDRVSTQILEEAGRELARAVHAVFTQLGMIDEPFPVACVGSVIRLGTPVRSALEVSLRQAAPLAQLIEPIHSPEMGAVLLAVSKLQGFHQNLT